MEDGLNTTINAEIEVRLTQERGEHNYVLINGHKISGVFDLAYYWDAKSNKPYLALKVWAHRVELTGDADIDLQIQHIVQHAPDGTKWEWRLADGETLLEWDDDNDMAGEE